MFEDVFSRRNLILKKIIYYFYDDFQDIILESIIKINDLELVFKSIILFSKKNYLGLYSLDHRKKLMSLLEESKKEEFVRGFTRYQSNFLKVNELEDYLKLEIFTLSLFYEKCYYDIYYQIDENNYLKCKKKIYHLYEKDIKSRYYYHRNLVMVKKGKSEVILNLQEVIYNILKNREVEPSVKKYVFKFHRTEYRIISDYLKYQKKLYF